MKNLWKTFIAIGLVLAIIQAPNLSEAKKIKKTLKELKKLRKYAYLLAANRKKLYAIPFPMPLPVFVKRQHIYTQVPIIPRYVQHPQAYGTPAMSADSSTNYELVSGNYLPDMRMPDSSSSYSSKGYSSSGSSGSSGASPSSSSSSSASSYGSSRKKPHSFSGGGSTNELASHYLGQSSKYLAQIANLLSQASPMIGNSNRDLLSKLLNGQARVLPPTALISAIKGSTSSASMLKPYDQEHQNQQHHHHHHHHQQQQQQQQQQQDQDQQQSSKSHSSSSASTAVVSYDDSAPSTTSKPESAASSSENKPSASELYKSSIAYGPMGPLRGAYMNAYPFPGMLNPMLTPMALLAAARRAQSMSRMPLQFRGPIGVDMMPMMDPYEGPNQIESAQNAHEPQEMSASSPQDHESASGAEYPPDASYAALIKQRQLQHQLQLQNQPEHLLVALQKAQRQQLLTRQQEALKLALLREQEVAARLAESRHALVRAHQMGLPMHAGQSNLVN